MYFVDPETFDQATIVEQPINSLNSFKLYMFDNVKTTNCVKMWEDDKIICDLLTQNTGYFRFYQKYNTQEMIDATLRPGAKCFMAMSGFDGTTHRRGFRIVDASGGTSHYVLPSFRTKANALAFVKQGGNGIYGVKDYDGILDEEVVTTSIENLPSSILALDEDTAKYLTRESVEMAILGYELAFNTVGKLRPDLIDNDLRRKAILSNIDNRYYIDYEKLLEESSDEFKEELKQKYPFLFQTASSSCAIL